MDSLHPQVAATVLVGASLAFIFFIYNIWRKRHAKTNRQNKGRPAAAAAAPEAGGAWPIIGHLLLLGGQKPIPRTLGAMADKYGPAFMLQLGVHRVLVLSSQELMKDCFTTNDLVFATRPRNTVGKYLGYNYALFPFSPYGPYWREIRKIATLELLSKTRLEMLKHVIATEVDTSVKQLYNGAHNPVKMEMNQWFNHLNLNVITKIIAGKRYFGIGEEEEEIEARRFRKAIERFAYQAGVFDLSDVLPYLEWMDLQGNVKAMKCIAKELDSLMENWMEEHHHKKQKRDSSRDATSSEGDQLDFIDVMLSILPEDKPEPLGYDRDTIIKATALTFILAGTETTSVTLLWALSLILNNQQVLKKAQEELDIHVGRDRHVDESDIKNLVYLDAIVKETLRLYPALPLSLPHEAMEDCEVGGYHVPKGTRLIINIWKLHRDPRVWSEPHEFRPERFLTGNDAADLDFKGRHFEYIPFSSGRRMCIGITFATKVMHLTLAHLLQGFILTSPMEMPIDMTEGLGASLPKANPLEVLLTPRLPSKLYE